MLSFVGFCYCWVFVSTFVETQQKLICRWSNGGVVGQEQTQKMDLGYTSLLEGDCKLFSDAAMKKKKVFFLRKEEVLISEICLWYLSGLVCTALYNWERVFVGEATSWCGI